MSPAGGQRAACRHSTMDATTELLDAIADIAASAAAAILEVYQGAFEVDAKADDSPITEADRRAHRIIHERLAARHPALPILSEEGGIPDWSIRRTWRRYWLVDPLDGTREFVSRNGEFTVNIALIEDGVPVLGVVHVPVTGVAYAGATARGAFRVETSGSRVPICVSPAPTRLRIVASRSHRDAETDALLQRIGAHELVPIGSSLKFCRVAEGAADFYPRFGPTNEWDTAAGQAVLEAAGGSVMMRDGVPLRCNSKESPLNPAFFAFGDSGRDWLRLL